MLSQPLPDTTQALIDLGDAPASAVEWFQRPGTLTRYNPDEYSQ